MEELTLPEPARSLWRKTAATLKRALSQTEHPPSRWSIGGGSILALRWGHRESTDIDLTAPNGSGIHRLDQRVGGTLEADMTAIGAVDVATGRTRHRIEFPGGSIDIAEVDARPDGGGRISAVDGHEVTVKSTTQILRGKLERALRQESPVRDLFDIAVAHHAEPAALAEAANMLNEEEFRQVKAHWLTSRHSLEHEAGSKLARVNPEYEAERRDPVGRAVERLDAALYLAVRIRATDTRVIIETRTRGQTPRTIETTHDEAAKTIERTGMAEFLSQHVAGNVRHVADPAELARVPGGTERTIVDWQRGPRR